MIKAIIFDADDTLYATHEAAKRAEIISMKFFAGQKNLGHEKMYADFIEIVEGIKKSKNPLKRHRLNSYGLLAKKHGLKDVERAYRLFFDAVLKEMTMMPNLERTLQKLAKKYTLAIVSQDFRSQITKKLDRFKLKKYFKCVITCDDSKVMKPHKKYYELAFKKLKVKASECVAIGDDYERDLAILKKMGAITVMYGYDPKADYCFLDYRKLPGILYEISKKHTE